MISSRGQGTVIHLAEKLALFSELWSPRVIAEFNENQIKLVKFQGEFVWHSHSQADEVFLVIGGEMEIGFRDRTLSLRAGDLAIVPQGEEHITRAAGECHALLIEPRGVVNTGDTGGAMTAANDVWV